MPEPALALAGAGGRKRGMYDWQRTLAESRTRASSHYTHNEEGHDYYAEVSNGDSLNAAGADVQAIMTLK